LANFKVDRNNKVVLQRAMDPASLRPTPDIPNVSNTNELQSLKNYVDEQREQMQNIIGGMQNDYRRLARAFDKSSIANFPSHEVELGGNTRNTSVVGCHDQPFYGMTMDTYPEQPQIGSKSADLHMSGPSARDRGPSRPATVGPISTTLYVIIVGVHTLLCSASAVRTRDTAAVIRVTPTPARGNPPAPRQPNQPVTLPHPRPTPRRRRHPRRHQGDLLTTTDTINGRESPPHPRPHAVDGRGLESAAASASAPGHGSTSAIRSLFSRPFARWSPTDLARPPRLGSHPCTPPEAAAGGTTGTMIFGRT
jgi:hypothetical protein